MPSTWHLRVTQFTELEDYHYNAKALLAKIVTPPGAGENPSQHAQVGPDWAPAGLLAGPQLGPIRVCQVFPRGAQLG